MNPKNFPGRKNDRRIRALAQVTRPNDTKVDRLQRAPGFSREKETKALLSRIVSDEAARGIRTKKDRSNRAKVRA